MEFTSIEIYAGAGGQAIGLEQAGFEHLALIETKSLPCEMLHKYNLKFRTIAMKTTLHFEKNEIIISDNFSWWK